MTHEKQVSYICEVLGLFTTTHLQIIDKMRATIPVDETLAHGSFQEFISENISTHSNISIVLQAIRTEKHRCARPLEVMPPFPIYSRHF